MANKKVGVEVGKAVKKALSKARKSAQDSANAVIQAGDGEASTKRRRK